MSSGIKLYFFSKRYAYGSDSKTDNNIFVDQSTECDEPALRRRHIIW